MFDILRSAWKLDTLDLVPMSSHAELLPASPHITSPKGPLAKFSVRSRFIRFLAFFYFFARSLCNFSGRRVPLSENKVLFVAHTKNQVRALSSTVQALASRELPTVFAYKESAQGDMLALRKWSFVWAVPFLPAVFWRMLSSRGFAWRSFAWGFDTYWQAYGLYVAHRRHLRKERPLAVVVSNDHNEWTRSIIAAAKDEDIPTIYIQHAPVTVHFPKLNMDYALLEGRHALEQYATIGKSETQIFLVGMPRLDAFLQKENSSERVHSIGLCIGFLDPKEESQQLLRAIQTSCPDVELTVRIHPRSNAKSIQEWQSVCKSLQVKYSDSRTERPFEFLHQMDAIIAGGSGIVLEAALMNVVPVMYELNGEASDWYGFAAAGLCPMFSTQESLLDFLQQLQKKKPSYRSRAKYYCATVDTKYDGQSSELAARVIEKIIRKKKGNSKEWKSIDDIPFSAYEPL